MERNRVELKYWNAFTKRFYDLAEWLQDSHFIPLFYFNDAFLQTMSFIITEKSRELLFFKTKTTEKRNADFGFWH